MKLRIKGVDISISYPFAAMLALILLLDINNIASAGLLAALFHELGHILWLVLSHTGIKQISFNAFGINIITKPGAIFTYYQETMLALAGPAFNLCIALLLFLVPDTDLVVRLRVANLLIMVVNMLPIQSLDGGTVFEALLYMKIDRETAEKIAFFVSILFLLPLLLIGFIFLLKSKYNFSLLIFAIFLLRSIVRQ